MKTQTLQRMQKAQKLAIKIICFVVIFFNSIGIAQTEEHKYYFLNKIIKLAQEENKDNDPFEMSYVYGGVRSPILKHYYKYRIDGFPFHKNFLVDSVTGEVGFDTLETKRSIPKWKEKYRVLDSLFDEKDIKRIIDYYSDKAIIKQEKKDTLQFLVCGIGVQKQDIKYNTSVKWDSLHPSIKDKKIKWCKYSCINSVSEPFYNFNKNHVFVLHGKKRYGTNIYIYRKEKDDWILIDLIKKAGWQLQASN